MNHLGMRAMTHWQQFLPRRYAALTDPQGYFTSLGEQMAREIDELTQELLANVPPSPDRETRIGQTNMAKRSAEDAVLRERLLPSSEDRI